MDHSQASAMMASERYLLDELTAEEQEAFEEHFFGCHECAMDVRTGSVFLQQSKVELAKPTTAAGRVSGEVREPSRLWAWWRPAFAVPVMAALLLVIGYQNLVTFPQLARSAKQPLLLHVLPATTLNLATYGDNASPLVVHAGEDILLNVIVPPGHRYEAYKVALRNPVGGVESVPIPVSADDTWPLQIPGANLQSGTYKLTVHGVTGPGQDVEVGSASFQLQVQK